MSGYQTGFFGMPGTSRSTQVHVVYDGQPLCRYRPAASMEFRFCAGGYHRPCVECGLCLRRADLLAVFNPDMGAAPGSEEVQ